MNLENSYSETFQDIFKRMLNRSSSRPPKIELTGLLIPCFEVSKGNIYSYKLGTDEKEYFLCIDDALKPLARMAAWEEVTVRGQLDLVKNVLDVEKINIAKPDDVAPIALGHFEEDFNVPLDFAKA